MPGLRLAGKAVSTAQKLEESIFGKFIDHDGEMKLDLEEFVEMMPERIREIHDRQTICSWYTTADENGDGKLSINEFFHWSLCSSKVNGAAILEEAFKLYDTDGSGTLNKREFKQMAFDLGFGHMASAAFAVLDDDRSGMITYKEVLDALKSNVPHNMETKKLIFGTTRYAKPNGVSDACHTRFSGFF